MAKTRSFCPYCHGIVPAGQRCTCRPRPKRKVTEADKTRMQREPWRRNYSTPEYQAARQVAIERTNGRCKDCGAVCARYEHGRWMTAGMGGEVDHEVALRDGGANDPANLTLRCKSCHGLRDAARRKGKTP